MKLMRFLFLAFIVMSITSCASTAINLFNKKIKPVEGMSQPISHELWDGLLQEHVQPDGNVDYASLLQERSKFDEYIKLLENNHPNPMNWSREESMAFWINAYNAFTVQKVLDHYPVSSIEPRIHFAVNCASISCPPLANFAFTGDELDDQLDLMTEKFLADTSKNVITADRLELSKIFNWYKPDFTDGQSLKEYINQYTDIDISPSAKIKYLPYDWGLNDIKLLST